MAKKTPAMPAMTEDAAQAMAWTRVALIPIKSAVRSSAATARMAMPNLRFSLFSSLTRSIIVFRSFRFCCQRV